MRLGVAAIATARARARLFRQAKFDDFSVAGRHHSTPYVLLFRSAHSSLGISGKASQFEIIRTEREIVVMNPFLKCDKKLAGTRKIIQSLQFGSIELRVEAAPRDPHVKLSVTILCSKAR